jgi:monoamine oxidase
MNRRQVLAAGLGVAAAGRRARAASRRIVVIGAGLAGLSAARDLAARGHEVVVLEARDRIGGRVHSSGLWPDLPMDLGASWIHGVRKNPLTGLADAAGAGRVATSYDAALMLGADGGEISPDLGPAEQILKAALRAAAGLDADVSVEAALEASAGWRRASEPQRRLVRHVVNSGLEQEYGGAAAALSAWYGDDAQVFGGEDVAFPQGFSQLTRWLARGLDIRLSQAVVGVAPGRVTLADGAVIEAAQILVTVPLGVLQAGTLQFETALQPGRVAALGALRMGLLNKAWLRFDRIAWPEDVDWIEWLGPNPGVWAEWLSLARGMKVPVLLGFHAGQEAAALERLSDRETVAQAHEALRAMFGSGFPAPIAAQITRWGQDPWSLGSYSFNAVGAVPKMRAALAGADWDGALWFAGEACAVDYFGTAHGAVLSGREIARRMG